MTIIGKILGALKSEKITAIIFEISYFLTKSGTIQGAPKCGKRTAIIQAHLVRREHPRPPN